LNNKWQKPKETGWCTSLFLVFKLDLYTNYATPFIITGIIDVVLSTVLLTIKTVAQIKNKATEKELK